jgi:hypothetical protein
MNDAYRVNCDKKMNGQKPAAPQHHWVGAAGLIHELDGC